MVTYGDAVSRSGTVEAGKDAASSQPNKRFQQTQAQVDEVSLFFHHLT